MTTTFYIENKKKLQKELLDLKASIKGLEFYRAHAIYMTSGKFIEIIENRQKISEIRLEDLSESHKVTRFIINNAEKSESALEFFNGVLPNNPKTMEYYVQDWVVERNDIMLTIESYPFADVLIIEGEDQIVNEFMQNIKNLKPAPISKWDIYQEVCQNSDICELSEISFRNYT